MSYGPRNPCSLISLSSPVRLSRCSGPARPPVTRRHRPAGRERGLSVSVRQGWTGYYGGGEGGWPLISRCEWFSRASMPDRAPAWILRQTVANLPGLPTRLTRAGIVYWSVGGRSSWARPAWSGKGVRAAVLRGQSLLTRRSVDDCRRSVCLSVRLSIDRHIACRHRLLLGFVVVVFDRFTALHQHLARSLLRHISAVL